MFIDTGGMSFSCQCGNGHQTWMELVESDQREKAEEGVRSKDTTVLVTVDAYDFIVLITYP